MTIRIASSSLGSACDGTGKALVTGECLCRYGRRSRCRRVLVVSLSRAVTSLRGSRRWWVYISLSGS